MNVSELKPGRQATVIEYGITGELYYCDRSDKWYVLHNDSEQEGNTPLDWEFVKKNKGYAYSWQISDGGSSETMYDVSIDDSTFSQKEVEPKVEPQKVSIVNGDNLSYVYHHLSMARLSEGDIRKSDGFLYCSENSTWYFLSAENKFHGTMPQEINKLKEKYEIRGGWQLTKTGASKVSEFWNNFTLENLVGSPKEKEPKEKDPNVINSGEALTPDLHLRRARLVTDFDVSDGVIYHCDYNKKYVFLSNSSSLKGAGGPRDWGHIVNSC